MHRRMADALTLIACIPPIVATVGWACESPIWASWLAGRPTMKLGTVVALWLLCGTSWAQRETHWSEAAALALAATLLIALGVSGLLLPSEVQPTQVFRGIVSAGTAVGVFLLAAVAIGDAAARQPAVKIHLICGGMTVVLGALAILGVLINWAPLYWHGPGGTGMAMPTAVSLTCLGIVQVLRGRDS